MLDFILANISTILIGMAVAALTLLITVKMIINKKRGKSSCSGCAGCSMAGGCHTQPCECSDKNS